MLSRWPRAGSRSSARRSTRCSSTRAGNSSPSSSTQDRKSTRLNSSHLVISYAVFCLKKKHPKHIGIQEEIPRDGIGMCAVLMSDRRGAAGHLEHRTVVGILHLTRDPCFYSRRPLLS